MKFKLTYLMLGLLVVLAACNSGGGSSTENQLETLKDNYPEVKTELEKLPEEFRNEITVPSKKSVPLDVSEVEAVAETKLKPYGMNFYYVEDEKRLNVSIKDQKGIDVSLGKDSNQELDNDINGYYSEGGGISKLMWLSENKNALYSIQGVVPPEQDSPFKKEEMVEIANSIIQQRK
ncbi:hypothetical protein [Pseudalkalibacillus hwajinpoensis]|uniref:DUF4367 domain-containing protein n=1 Tax=Guptibacillus hwajinpoensis TaxID=208199 RepID=A0A4U1MLC6_9BACL|nr:hypothetical protein [Pseudalkalibacillus hwajinpoensis]TKD71504.1 hypothetical protein FBF83_01450 [Pseudalkalibacillus hwajinpoensis]